MVGRVTWVSQCLSVVQQSHKWRVSSCSANFTDVEYIVKSAFLPSSCDLGSPKWDQNCRAIVDKDDTKLSKKRAITLVIELDKRLQIVAQVDRRAHSIRGTNLSCELLNCFRCGDYSMYSTFLTASPGPVLVRYSRNWSVSNLEGTEPQIWENLYI